MDRERSGGPTVEFVGEEPEPSAGDEQRVVGSRARDRALIAAGLLVALLLFAAVGHVHGTPTAAHRPPAHVPKPARVAPAKPEPVAQVETFAGSPTAAIMKAFATHIPGAIVISEHTVLTNRGRELDARRIRAVSGNVILDIVVSRSSAAEPPHATRIMHGVYAVTIRSKGFYPPTHEQLQQLAADRRLTAVV